MRRGMWGGGSGHGSNGRRPGGDAQAAGGSLPVLEAAGTHPSSKRRSPTPGEALGPPHAQWTAS